MTLPKTNVAIDYDPPVDGSWVALTRFDDCHVIVEWRRGEKPMRLTDCLDDVRAVRAEVEEQIAENGGAQSFYLRRRDGRWFGALSVHELEWLPDHSYGATQ